MTKKNNISKHTLKAKRNILLAFSFCFLAFSPKAQVNYVQNGSFEKIDTCMQFSGPVAAIYNAPPWDTLVNGGGGNCLIMNRCFNPNNYAGVPYNLNGGGYQEPRSGDSYAYFIFLKLTPNPAVNWRNYIQQKMTHKLILGKSYCVTYWANLVNYVNYAVDELGAYFDDGSIQSIAPIKEAPANPQVKSPSGIF